MGVQKNYGTVIEGKYADLILVPGGPLRDINVVRNPVIVIKNSKRYK